MAYRRAIRSHAWDGSVWDEFGWSFEERKGGSGKIGVLVGEKYPNAGGEDRIFVVWDRRVVVANLWACVLPRTLQWPPIQCT